MAKETQYIFFSGKGGVGKTSCSAAAALKFAREGKKTLVISVDPAHSLADSFDQKIGGEIVELEKNLFALEIDPVKAMEEYKEKLNLFAADKLEMLKGFGLDETFDIAGLTPGIDEIAAFDKFMQYMQNKEYDVIIFDTAPTGHALRFLSLPDVLDSWVGKLIKLRLKFSGMFGFFKKILPFGEDKEESVGAEQLDAMKKRIETAKSILTDKNKTKVNLVLIPEAMSILESERALKTLKGYNMDVENIIVNQMLPDNKCDFCQERRKNQLKRLEEIKKKFKGHKVLTLSQFKQEVQGKQMLEKVAKELYSR